MDAERARRLRALAKRLGHEFSEARHLDRALTHASRAYEAGTSDVRDNETLEFLGDAVLGFVVSDLLHRHDPEGPEGTKSRARAELISEASLAPRAERLGLPELLLLGRGEEKTGGRHKNALWADAYEAVIAALYLDGGLEAAAAFVRAEFQAEIQSGAVRGGPDPKSALQELLQGRGEPVPEYLVLHETGPSHQRLFEVACRIGGRDVATGSGSSKKAAQRDAARKALERLGL
jgi:ribonuclease III